MFSFCDILMYINKKDDVYESFKREKMGRRAARSGC